MTTSRERIELALFVHKLTKNALLVNETGKKDSGGKAISGSFLPLSEIEFPDDEEAKLEKWDAQEGPLFGKAPLQLNVLVPEWLAEREGLI